MSYVYVRLEVIFTRKYICVCSSHHAAVVQNYATETSHCSSDKWVALICHLMLAICNTNSLTHTLTLTEHVAAKRDISTMAHYIVWVRVCVSNRNCYAISASATIKNNIAFISHTSINVCTIWMKISAACLFPPTTFCVLQLPSDEYVNWMLMATPWPSAWFFLNLDIAWYRQAHITDNISNRSSYAKIPCHHRYIYGIPLPQKTKIIIENQ